MAVATEVSRIRRATEEFVANVGSDLRSKAGLSAADRRLLRAEIEVARNCSMSCMRDSVLREVGGQAWT